MFRNIIQYFNKKNLKDNKYEFLFDKTSNDEYPKTGKNRRYYQMVEP